MFVNSSACTASASATGRPGAVCFGGSACNTHSVCHPRAGPLQGRIVNEVLHSELLIALSAGSPFSTTQTEVLVLRAVGRTEAQFAFLIFIVHMLSPRSLANHIILLIQKRKAKKDNELEIFTETLSALHS